MPLELAPKARWQPGERERLAATESARYFSTGSFTERMERKSGRVVLQELGFGDDVWLFRNYILPGKLDAARKSLVGQWHYSPRRVEEINNGWHSTEAKSAEQALRSGDVEALINTRKMIATHVIVRKRVSGTCIYWHSCRVRWL
ncbi:hypothetical protein DMI66_05440 [Escherichia coli]|nr:hypothetical protein [Escherichia coli]